MNQGGEKETRLALALASNVFQIELAADDGRLFQKYCRHPENSETTVEPGRACVDKSASESASEESGGLKTAGELGFPDLAN